MKIRYAVAAIVLGTTWPYLAVVAARLISGTL